MSPSVNAGPRVQRMTPASRNVSAAPGPVTLFFDRPLRRDSVVLGRTLHVFGRASGSARGSVGFVEEDRALVFTPERPFAAGVMVTVLVARDVRGADGLRLGPGGFSAQFWTRAAAAPRHLHRDRAPFDAPLPGLPFAGVRRCGHRPRRGRRRRPRDRQRGLVRPGRVPEPRRGRLRPHRRALRPGPAGQPLRGRRLRPRRHDRRRGGEHRRRHGHRPPRPRRRRGPILAGGGGGLDASRDRRPRCGRGRRPRPRHRELRLRRRGRPRERRRDLPRGVADRFRAFWRVGDRCRGHGRGRPAGPGGGLADRGCGGVLRNQGNGSFSRLGRGDAGGGPWMLVTGDIDRDGHDDVAVVNGTSNTAAVLRGDGRGGFGPAAVQAVDPFALASDLGDLDGDGDLDWLTSSYSGDWRLFENREGVLVTAQELAPREAASCALLFDADGDGDVDLALIDEEADEVILMRNGG